jgi:hypothetical protein
MTWVRGWFQVTSKEEMRAKAWPMYQQHYALVRATTPPRRLLEYRLGSGWEPLCEFLHKPVPDVPFPHVNEREAMPKMIKEVVQANAAKLGRWMLLLLMIPLLRALGAQRFRS